MAQNRKAEIGIEFLFNAENEIENVLVQYGDTKTRFYKDGRTDADRVNPQRFDMDNEHVDKRTTDFLRFFDYEHLPEKLQAVSKPFHALAHVAVALLPICAERTVALRKLLEAKDAAVRAAL